VVTLFQLDAVHRDVGCLHNHESNCMSKYLKFRAYSLKRIELTAYSIGDYSRIL
jgi:hypothetical protein